MIDFVRGIIETIATTAKNWGLMKWFGQGYADEHLSGRLYQHYGFKSYPPEGTEAVIFSKGNNCFTVAENDQNINPGTLNDLPFEPGNVIVYSKYPGKLFFLSNEISIRVLDNVANNALTINNNPVIPGIIMVSDVPVSIKKPGEEVYYLVNEKFLKDFCSHTHAGAPTGPLVNGILATYPGTLTPDVTKTLMSDGQ